MANQITDQRILINAADNATGYVDLSGGAAGTLDTEIFIQGTGSIGQYLTSALAGLLYDFGTATDVSNNVFYIRINCGIVGLLDTQANGGFRIRFTGATVTDWFEVYVGGSDQWPAAIAGGWVTFVVDVETARSTAITNGWTSGTVPATTAIQRFGWAGITGGTMPRMVDNTWMDASYRLPDGTAGIRIEGQNGGATPWTFQDIFTQLGQAAGVFVPAEAGGGFVVNTPIQIGINDATTHSFSDTNALILWADQQYAPADLYGVTVIGAGTGTVNVTLGVKAGTGTSATGSQGCTFAAGSTQVRWFLDADGADIDSVGLYGCTFIHGSDFQLDSTAVETVSCQFIDCSSLTPNNAALFQFNSIIDANTLDGVAFLTSDDPSDIENCEFIFSDGHAIEFTAAGTFAFTGNNFSGYGADGTNDAAVYNNSGGALTLNISGGGNTPTVRNGTGASTTVNNTVNFRVTNIQPNSELRIYDASDTTIELAGTETVSGELTSFTISNAGSGYSVSDVLTLSGGTFTTAAQITVDSVDGGGAITAATISTAGSYTEAPSNPASLTGGTGTGAQINATIRGSFLYQYNYSVDTPIIIVVFSLSYQDLRVVGQSLLSTDQSIPIQQTVDRVYSNPP